MLLAENQETLDERVPKRVGLHFILSLSMFTLRLLITGPRRLLFSPNSCIFRLLSMCFHFNLIFF